VQNGNARIRALSAATTNAPGDTAESIGFDVRFATSNWIEQPKRVRVHPRNVPKQSVRPSAEYTNETSPSGGWLASRRIDGVIRCVY